MINVTHLSYGVEYKILQRKRSDAHTKLSCSVPISGLLGNRLTGFRGERADLQKKITVIKISEKWP